MQRVIREGTGSRAQALGRPAAGKTGTAALRKDTTTSSWFVGYTPQLSAAVDFYKGDGTADLDGVGGLPTFFGGNYPTRIWTAFMRGALRGQKVLDFPEPAYVGKIVNPPPAPRPTTASPTPSQTPSPTETVTVTPSSPPPSPSPPATPEPSPSLTPQVEEDADGDQAVGGSG
jgi:membrane peptidoglycan carboxypeptidase